MLVNTKEFEMEASTRNMLCVATAALAVGCSVSYLFYKLRKRKLKAVDLFDYLTIETVNSDEFCDEVVEELRRRCKEYRALGFDCEWVTDKGKRHPVALIQLSSFDGYCGLFRLNAMKAVPASLKDLLENRTIYKVGVAPADDGKYLKNDFGVVLKSTLDIRHLAKLSGFEAGGLATLSSALLGVSLDKSWRVRCSDWEAEELSSRQVNYAAIDAHVAIRIFAILLQKLDRKESVLSWVFGEDPSVWARYLDNHCSKFADVHFKLKHTKFNDTSKEKIVRVKEPPVPTKRYSAPKRLTPLYNNGFLHAPDGELLCTCNKKKAMWFVNNGLADLIKEDPITVRLNFEPAGRPTGDAGRYYQLEKQNQCVVCGDSNSYIRKNIVPRDYRKHFPEIMKDHSSHDVVLLCATCHQRSNINDLAVREKLVSLCDAPLATEQRGRRTYEQPTLKKIRSSARALLYMSQKMPEARRKELEDILLQHYPDQDEVSEELLKEACDIQVVFENEDYESHGAKVVDYYIKNGGLLLLEELWRKHFLTTMKPRFMPDLWSLTHTEERLRVRLKEGRITQEDLKSVGLTSL